MDLVPVQFEPLRAGDNPDERDAAIKHALFWLYEHGHLWTDSPSHIGAPGTRPPESQPTL